MLEYMSKLTPFIASVEDCDNCVIIRMKPGCGSELVKLGYFRGTEMQFRLPKEKVLGIAVWYSDGEYTECLNSSFDRNIRNLLVYSAAWDFNVDLDS